MLVSAPPLDLAAIPPPDTCTDQSLLIEVSTTMYCLQAWLACGSCAPAQVMTRERSYPLLAPAILLAASSPPPSLLSEHVELDGDLCCRYL